MKFWPFVLKSTHRKVQLENYTLRDALREANAELRKHRALIAALKDGSPTDLDRFFKLKGQTNGKRSRGPLQGP